MHNELSMNVTVANARTILSVVSGLTGVDSYLLLEDEGFCTKLRQLRTGSLSVAYDELTAYVNANY